MFRRSCRKPSNVAMRVMGGKGSYVASTVYSFSSKSLRASACVP
jgi:hypothetical protein